MPDGAKLRLQGFDALEKELKSLGEDVQSERIVRAGVRAAATGAGPLLGPATGVTGATTEVARTGARPRVDLP